MAIKTDSGRYKCFYCSKVYDNMVDADNCKDNHNLVRIALTLDELNQLIHFIFSGDRKLINPDTVLRLQKAQRDAVKNAIKKQ
jgi:hypothetical protein